MIAKWSRSNPREPEYRYGTVDARLAVVVDGDTDTLEEGTRRVNERPDTTPYKIAKKHSLKRMVDLLDEARKVPYGYREQNRHFYRRMSLLEGAVKEKHKMLAREEEQRNDSESASA